MKMALRDGPNGLEVKRNGGWEPAEIISSEFSMSVGGKEVVHISSGQDKETTVTADATAVSVSQDPEKREIRITLLPPESPGFVSRVLDALRLK
jgi:hypothetical protein